LLAQLHNLVQNGRGLSICEIAEDVEVSCALCQAILIKCFGMKHISAKFGDC